ncbi:MULTISPECIES: hypothetical protein [unclassified Streptomyces]|uniref:hypothetical protein n=1 Tax=unclassified Streptomyces TaxID=2593676 RepID=UPI002DDB8E04|nr:hypothetical protein [Streptomyces sp. NBC_01237]WRZ72234.1 hypothetical protein OG251_11680 [Streptomyces sp. NBC_01237]
MTAPAPFGPLQFQLVLLRRMADHQPGLVEEARQELSASLADMREANRHWQAMVRAPRGGASRGSLRRYRSVLGEPELTLPRRIGDLECEALLWPVPLWPGLRFEVTAAPGGAVWNEWLVRAPGTAGPEPRTTADLLPWSCTVEEVARAFAPARPMEGSAPTRWALAITDPESGRPFVAEFTWGLFQRLLPGRPG